MAESLEAQRSRIEQLKANLQTLAVGRRAKRCTMRVSAYRWDVKRAEKFADAFGGVVYDVQAAKGILAKVDREVKECSLGGPYAEFWEDALDSGVSETDAETKAHNCDDELPVIVAQRAGVFLMIDGHHRLWRRRHAGETKVGVALLTEAESAQVRK